MSERIRAFYVFDPSVGRWCWWGSRPPQALLEKEGVRLHPFEVEIPDEDGKPTEIVHVLVPEGDGQTRGLCGHRYGVGDERHIFIAKDLMRYKRITCTGCANILALYGMPIK